MPNTASNDGLGSRFHGNGWLALMHSARYAMQRRLILWSVFLVIAPTLGSAWWLSSIARHELLAQHDRTVQQLARSVAASILDHDNRTDHAECQEVLEALSVDPRYAFVMVLGTDGEVMHRNAADFDAWQKYEQWAASHSNNLAMHLNHRILLDKQQSLIARVVPVWNTPHAHHHPGPGVSEHRQLSGFVVLALRDPGMARLLDALRRSQIGAACLVCLVAIPLVIYACRRWTQPLRYLLGATLTTARGEKAEPIPVLREDELGILTRAFNRMTERLGRAQEELQATNRDLELQVHRRTRDLEQANAQLHRLLDDREQFMRSVSHDLGAPLRNISGMSSMLLMKYKDMLTDDALNKIERIAANANMQADLLNDLLELSRIRATAGKREWIDLQELVQSLADSLSYDLERSGIELTVQPGLPTIYAERNRMRQVFQNLLDNAVKYMLDQPTRRVHVGYEQSDHELRFTVTDTGTGIDPADQAHIFDVFRRGRGTSDAVAGRGLGLAGTKTIVEAYGGTIDLESTPGEGTTFTFTLDPQRVLPPTVSWPAQTTESA